jgi:hypothetical protein
MQEKLELTRRMFLKVSALVAAGITSPGLLRLHKALAQRVNPRRANIDHYVILVAFAGGVRNKETILKPQNVPNIMRLAQEGVVIPNVTVKGAGHFGCTYTIFTGCPEVEGIRSMNRSPNPTVFEEVRKATGLGADKVWLSTVGGQQENRLAYGMHKDFGPAYGANQISSEGIFNKEFKTVLDHLGRPSLPTEREATAIAQVREEVRKVSTPRITDQGTVTNDPRRTAELERFILDEIAKDSAQVTAPGGGDAQAIRMAWQITRIFQPNLLGIRLAQADVGHGSYNAYVDVLRRNDAEIGKLWDQVQADPVMRGKTSLLLVPEFGRDRDLNKQGGLDHGDGSDDLRKITLIAVGPKFKRGKILRTECDLCDVKPTVCHLFGVEAQVTDGRVLYEALG